MQTRSGRAAVALESNVKPNRNWLATNAACILRIIQRSAKKIVLRHNHDDSDAKTENKLWETTENKVRENTKK